MCIRDSIYTCLPVVFCVCVFVVKTLSVVVECFVCAYVYVLVPRQSTKDTTPTTTRKKDRSRSKSPFRSFRWKKSTPKSPAQTSASDDEGNLERAAGRLFIVNSILIFTGDT